MRTLTKEEQKQEAKELQEILAKYPKEVQEAGLENLGELNLKQREMWFNLDQELRQWKAKWDKISNVVYDLVEEDGIPCLMPRMGITQNLEELLTKGEEETES